MGRIFRRDINTQKTLQDGTISHQKNQQIQDKVDTIFYEGDFRWTNVFGERKKYTSKSSATADLYGFGGTVITE